MAKEGLLHQLPPPPPGKTGWPWTEETDPGLFSLDIDWPKISIVTPSYNQGAFIEETIRSVLLQNYPNLEYVVIDGGSTDASVEIIRKYERWISFWVSEKDNGQSEAINKGIEKTGGTILNWINSDDYYLPEAFQKIATNFIQSPYIDVLCGTEYLLSENGDLEVTPGTTVLNTVYDTILKAHIDQPPTFFKRTFFESIGGISNDLSYTMDAEFWLRYLIKFGQNRIKKINDALTVFRLHENSKTISKQQLFCQEKALWMYSFMLDANVPPFILDEWIYSNQIQNKIHCFQTTRNWSYNNRFVSQNKVKQTFIKAYAQQKYNRREFKDAQKAVLKILPYDVLNYNLSKLKIKVFLKPIIEKIVNSTNG